MNNSNPAPVAFSRAYLEHSQANLTNASFRWQPDKKPSMNVEGQALVMLCSPNNKFGVDVGLFNTHLGLVVWFTYRTKEIVKWSEWLPLPNTEHVYLELDIEPKTSNVAFWVNDKGMDMGVLPGFKGGANLARWMAAGHVGNEMLSGTFQDCAVASSSGWSTPVFHRDNIINHRLHSDHLVDVLSPNSIATGNRRSLA